MQREREREREGEREGGERERETETERLCVRDSVTIKKRFLFSGAVYAYVSVSKLGCCIAHLSPPGYTFTVVYKSF